MSTYELGKMLETAGLTASDVDIKILRFTQMGAAFANKAIDAALVIPPFTYEFAQQLFIGDDERHTEWTFDREIGEPLVDQLLSPTGPMLAETADGHALDVDRLSRLLDLIGPAVVMSHSAGGPAGWLLADARPDLVKALVAVEPMGPPFNPLFGRGLAYGLAGAPLTYDPPVSSPDELELVESPPKAEGLPPTFLQQEPARTLPRLAGVPTVLVSGEVSVFAHFNEGTLAYLHQAGVPADRMHLPDHGVTGNGHAMMFERNSDKALQPILDWLAEHVPGTDTAPR